MRTLDTNVIVRLFTRDDPKQLTIAEDLIASPFLILPTVLLELVWVLSSRYALPRPVIASRMREFLRLDTATIGSAGCVFWALERYARGEDFADMLHIALADELKSNLFATFDKRVHRHDNSDLAIRVERLP